MIWASVVSSPWPCDATPKAAVIAPVESMRDLRGLRAGIDRHSGRDRDARPDAGQFGVGRDADTEHSALPLRASRLPHPKLFVAGGLGRPHRDIRRNRSCPR